MSERLERTVARLRGWRSDPRYEARRLAENALITAAHRLPQRLAYRVLIDQVVRYGPRDRHPLDMKLEDLLSAAEHGARKR